MEQKVLLFLLGIFIGYHGSSWMNGPKAAQRGERWGKWTREHIFRLPPVASQHNNTGGE